MRFWIAFVALSSSLVVALASERLSLSVVDGDTVKIVGPGRDRPVRLVGLNAPETGFRAACAAERKLGAKAKRRLGELVERFGGAQSGSTRFAGGARLTLVACSCPEKGNTRFACNYGRACGVLTLGGRDVAETMIGEGLAVAYRCGAHHCPRLPRPWCEGPPR